METSNLPSANESVTIIDTTIPIVEYQGHRVITLATMDQLHRRPEGTAGRNFREHKDKFEEGKHYFHLSYQEVKSNDEFRRLGLTASPRGLVVLTERGYSMLVKSFNDDFAWEVQDQLVDSYFDSSKPMSMAEFLVQQANLILEHEQKIKRLEQRQKTADIRIAETKIEIEQINRRTEEAFEAAAAALKHKHGDPEHFTIIGFANKHGITLKTEEPKVLGLHATKLSRDRDRAILKIPDDRWGKVNSYHISILKEVFSRHLAE